MAGQFLQLLINVSTKLEGFDKEIKHANNANESNKARIDLLADRIARLEKSEEYQQRDREEANGRMTTGDKTFGRMKEEIKTLKVEVAALQKIHDEKGDRPTGWRKIAKSELIRSLIPMGVGFLFWALYHVLLVGPQIAKALKAIKGTE
jgi:chromosome segregation ATPase